MTVIYTKNGVIEYIQSGDACIIADESNRDYRKVMAQDVITPFDRFEIVDTTVTTPSLQDQINTLAYLMGV